MNRIGLLVEKTRFSTEVQLVLVGTEGIGMRKQGIGNFLKVGENRHFAINHIRPCCTGIRILLIFKQSYKVRVTDKLTHGNNRWRGVDHRDGTTEWLCAVAGTIIK